MMMRQILQGAGLALALIVGLTLIANPAAAQQPGEVKAWGLDSSGQLGDGLFDSSTRPEWSWYAFPVTSIAAGGYHSLAVTKSGTVLAWGDNSSGNLGNGTNVNSPNVAAVPGLTGVVSVAANLHSLAVKTDGTVWAWGDNSTGQLGDGTRTTRTAPVQVPNLAGIIAVAAGDSHSLALQSYPCIIVVGAAAQPSEGQANLAGGPLTPMCTRVLAWGGGASGQLGNGANGDSNTPVVVSGLSGVVAIAAGHLHSLALKSDGTVWAWGYNEYGQLGNGTVSDSNTPVQVTGLSGVTAISAGGLHSVALKSDGTVVTWGSNWLGQLGNGFYTDSHVPVTSWLLPPVVAIAAGPFYTVALKADGTGWAWGWNFYGQLGNVTSIQNSNTPIQVQELVGASKVSAGGGHVLALVDPRDSITPTSINFGLVPAGTSVCHTVSVSNGGDDGLLLNAISITGADASQFSFSWGFLPISIGLNTTLPIPVCFNPTATGARNATVVFDDYGFNGPHSVTVSGTGYIPADLTVTQTVVLAGRRLTYTINVRNNGPGPAPNTTLSDSLPAQTQLVGIAGPGCHTSILGKTTCEPFDLPSGGLATFTLVVDITATTPIQITNMVSVSSGVPDPNTRDNVSRIVTNWPGK